MDFSNFQQVYDKLEQNIGSKYIYLKAKKSLQDLVFLLSEYSKIAYAAAKEPFAAEKENYVLYVNKLREAVKVIDITNKPLKNIMALLAKIIGKRELPESNEDYMAISKIINAWSCRNVIGAELYDAIRGDVAAQFEYAKQVSGDAAEYWYNESGEGGYLPAQQVLYKKCKPAGYWYERAAQNGDKYAILNVAFCYYYGGDGVEKNMHKAAYWLKAAVKYEQPGVEKARYCLACLYKTGIAVDQDFEQAYVLANLSAKANYIDAILLTAELIYNGQGVAQNKIKAFLILRENKRYFEIEKYFVNDNYDLHRTIAERFSSLNDDIDRPDVKYHSKYFWYKLDFEHNGNVDSAYICGELYMKKRVCAKQEKNLLEALRWFDICARRKNLAAMKKAGDICYFKLGKKRQAMKYYARGMLHGDGYCSGMLCKWLCTRGVVAYLVLSVVVHGIGVHIYDEDKVRKDNRNFEIAKRNLEQMISKYQQDKYANTDDISRFRNDIEVLKNISRKQKIYRYLDKYLLFSEYNPLRYSEVTDQYNDYYEYMLHSMEEKERLSSNGTTRENREENRKENQQKNSSSTQNSDMNLSQNDIKDAARLFCAYHEKLTDHNFDGAYAMLTDKRKSNLGSSSKLAESYRNTLESTVTDITCKDIDGNEVIFNYELRARDKVKGPKILVQYYEGEVHLFKNKGQWRIGYAESKKVSERYE